MDATIVRHTMPNPNVTVNKFPHEVLNEIKETNDVTNAFRSRDMRERANCSGVGKTYDTEPCPGLDSLYLEDQWFINRVRQNCVTKK